MKKYYFAVILLACGINFSLISQDKTIQNKTEFENYIKATINKLMESSTKEDSIIVIDDMLFLKEQLLIKGSFDGNRWPYGEVYYSFNTNVSEANKQNFLNAAQNWEDCADITFIERTTQPNYIEVKDHPSANNSYVGMIGGPQIINIHNWDYEFVIAHEIAHSLGAIHEHQRSDRDSFITILTANIEPGKEHNFIIISNSDNYTDYDFESVMHYSKNAFSIDPANLNTMEPKPGYEGFLDLMGLLSQISSKDKEAMAYRYRSMLDIALVIDRSGSMGSYGYMEPAKNAAKDFVSLMQLNDYLAVTSFSTSATVNFPFTQITTEQIKTNARNAISGIYSSGRTSIGIGMQSAQNQLNQGNVNKTQGMILLSDGWENEPPWVSQVLPTIPGNTDIYTIALGPNSDQNLLNNIASATGGFYSYSPNTQRLSLIYNSIRAKVTGQQTLAWIIGLIAQGQNIFQNVFIDGGVSFADFSLTWPGSDLDLELTDPNGIIIGHNTIDPNISFTSGSTYENYAIINPIPGQYTMKITGVSVTGLEPYNAIVSAISSLTMDVAFNKSIYGTNEPILITAEIMDGSIAVTGALVTADVTAPVNMNYIPAGSMTLEEPLKGKPLLYKEINTENGLYIDDSSNVFYSYNKSNLTLFDDGQHGDGAADDGIYGNYYTTTSVSGSYSFDVSASGIAPQSGNFTRIASKSTTVTTVQSIVVTNPQTGANFYSECTHPINWSSTNIAGNVNIYLSTNGGSTFATTLALNTPDDGIEEVLIPVLQSNNCRIKVQSVNFTSISGLNPGNFNILTVGVAGTITGVNMVNPGQNNVPYSIDAIQNATGYTWEYTGTGATINGSTNNITIDFASNATSGILTVKAANACGNAAWSPEYLITVISCTNPTFAGEIGNAQSHCGGLDPDPLSSISVPIGYVGTIEYKWQSSIDNISFFDIPNSNSETYDPGFIDITNWYKRLARVDCMNDWTGAAESNVVEITILPGILPGPAGVITGQAVVCNYSQAIYCVPDITDATSYIWEYSGTGVVFVEMAKCQSCIILQFTGEATSGILTVKGHNDCGDGLVSTEFPIVVEYYPGEAGPVTGLNKVNQGDLGVSYSIPVIPNATSYLWSYTGAGVTINGTGNSVTLDFSASATSGVLSVAGQNNCGSIHIVYFPITVNPYIPIYGPTLVVPGQQQVPYFVNKDPKITNYFWNYTGEGGTIFGKTNAITINFSPNATSGILYMKGQNEGGEMFDSKLKIDVALGFSNNEGKATVINSISENELETNVTIFPNPVEDVINVTSNVNLKGIIITNSTGKIMYNESASGNNGQVDVSSFVPGIYFIKIETQNNFIVKKVSVR